MNHMGEGPWVIPDSAIIGGFVQKKTTVLMFEQEEGLAEGVRAECLKQQQQHASMYSCDKNWEEY